MNLYSRVDCGVKFDVSDYFTVRPWKSFMPINGFRECFDIYSQNCKYFGYFMCNNICFMTTYIWILFLAEIPGFYCSIQNLHRNHLHLTYNLHSDQLHFSSRLFAITFEDILLRCLSEYSLRDISESIKSSNLPQCFPSFETQWRETCWINKHWF